MSSFGQSPRTELKYSPKSWTLEPHTVRPYLRPPVTWCRNCDMHRIVRNYVYALRTVKLSMSQYLLVPVFITPRNITIICLFPHRNCGLPEVYSIALTHKHRFASTTRLSFCPIKEFIFQTTLQHRTTISKGLSTT